MTGLQFDDHLWVCGYCKAVCIDYPTMKEHRTTRCKVRQAIARRRAEGIPTSVVVEAQKVLEAWGLR